MKKNKGFTLLETVIAIGILVMVGAVAVGASTRAINTGTYTKNRTRAQDLARRQIEGLKALRDTNYKAGKAWDYHLGQNEHGICAGHVTGGPAQSNIDFVCGTIDQTVDSVVFHVSTQVQDVEDNRNDGDNGPGSETNPQNGYPNGLDESKNMRLITVTVTWSEPGLPGSNQSVKFLSYLTNDKISD
jgi:prepilin-type N-terminal cleavage/methylation domain-containing protein